MGTFIRVCFLNISQNFQKGDLAILSFILCVNSLPVSRDSYCLLVSFVKCLYQNKQNTGPHLKPNFKLFKHSYSALKIFGGDKYKFGDDKQSSNITKRELNAARNSASLK